VIRFIKLLFDVDTNELTTAIIAGEPAIKIINKIPIIKMDSMTGKPASCAFLYFMFH